MTQYKKILGFWCAKFNDKWYVHIDLRETPFGSKMNIQYNNSYYEITIDFHQNGEHYHGGWNNIYTSQRNYIELDTLLFLFYTFVRDIIRFYTKHNKMFYLIQHIMHKQIITCCFCNKEFNNKCSFCLHWRHFDKFKKISFDNSFDIYIPYYKLNSSMKRCLHECSFDDDLCCKCLDGQHEIKRDKNGFISNVSHKKLCGVCRNTHHSKLVRYDEFVKYVSYIRHIVFRDVANVIIDFLFDYNKDVYVMG